MTVVTGGDGGFLFSWGVGGQDGRARLIKDLEDAWPAASVLWMVCVELSMY